MREIFIFLKRMMKEIIILLSNNMLFKALLICVSLDSILGALRAIKEHKFNSCVGIDGAISNVVFSMFTYVN